MKLNRLLMASLLGFSLITSSALACDKGSSSSSGSSQESHWSFFGWCHHDDADSHKRECDQNGQNSGTGNNCDHGKGNGGGYCGTSSSGSSSGSTNTGSLPGKGVS
jgi:hypothetical protein